jgi:uncharacterized repeat protein (TIGR01451 family)
MAGAVSPRLPPPPTGVSWSDAAWGDYDNDGDLDIFLAGYVSGGVPVTEVWRNDGGGSFSQASTAPTDVVYGSGAWGDYDNDGDLDILLAGQNSSSAAVTEVWRNEDCPPDLSIVKTATPSTAAPGGTITYTLTFSNAGGVTVTGVVITDSVPVSVTSPTVVGSSGAAITLTGSAPHFVWSVANLAPGQDGVITLTGVLSEPLAAGVFTNTAEIACAETEGDDTNNSSDAALTVQNVAPVAAAGSDQTVLISTTVTLDGSASSDANGDALTYGWAQTGGPSVALSDASAISPTFTAPASETVLTFTLTVTDSHGLADSTPDEVVVTVTSNLPPIADAGDDQSVTTSATVTLDGSGSTDPDGHTPLTYGWAQTGGTTVGLSDATAESPAFTAPSATSLLTFTLTVTDALGLADATPDEVAVNVVSGGTSTPVDPATGGSLVYTTTQTGGTVTTTIDIPPGAVTDTISLIYTEIPSSTNDPPDSFSFAGRTFTLDAYLGTVLQVGYVFKTPITITLDYDPDALGDVDEATLELHYWDGSQWTSAGIVVVERDTTNHRLVVTIAHLTEFAMLGTGGQHTIYLPLAFKNYVAAPDLVVQSITATSDGVQVVIENQGNAPVTGESALPLAPGDVLTLTVGDGYYVPEYSQVAWPLAEGTPVYAQVDSASADTTYGAVLENHEITDGTYNNISSTVSTAAVAGELYRW